MPHVYGPEHFIYLATVIILMAGGFWLIHHYVKTEKQIRLVIRITGGLLLLMIVWNRISIAVLRDGFGELLPGSFCGTSSLALALSALFLKKDHPVFHCVAFIGLLGGLITLAYPDFIGQADSIFYPMTISGLAHHTVMVFLALVMITTGYVKPKLSKWYMSFLGLSLYLTYGLFLVQVFNYGDAMYIEEPILEGTGMYWYVLALIYLPFHAIFLSVWQLVDEKRHIGYCLVNPQHA